MSFTIEVSTTINAHGTYFQDLLEIQKWLHQNFKKKQQTYTTCIVMYVVGSNLKLHYGLSKQIIF